jgi:anti-sigma B factor antagonist
MQITTYPLDPALVVQIDSARIDAAAAIEFKETVRQAIEAPGNPVILDMAQVSFLDSSGLGAVVAIRKLLGESRPLQLASLTPPVAKVFRLTRMDSVFTILDSVPRPRVARA